MPQKQPEPVSRLAKLAPEYSLPTPRRLRLQPTEPVLVAREQAELVLLRQPEQELAAPVRAQP
jgi:hypothetical protein